MIEQGICKTKEEALELQREYANLYPEEEVRSEKYLEAKNDARKKYVEVIEEFKNQRNGILLDKQDFENERYKNSQSELENLSNDAKQSLKNNMSDLANDIVEKVIGYKCDSNDFENEVVDKVLWGK